MRYLTPIALLLAAQLAWAEDTVTDQTVAPRLFAVGADVQYQQKLVTDADPLNDMSLLYNTRMTLRLPWEGMALHAHTGLSERFVAQPDESGFRLQDSALAFTARHPLAFSDGQLALSHRARLWFPTSRTSRNQSLRLAPDWRTALRYTPGAGVSISLQGTAQYRWYRYAEMAGRFGGMNTQLVGGTSLVLGYEVFDSPRFGKVSTTVSGGSQWRRTYASRETYVGEGSDAANWSQTYGWSVGVGYAPGTWGSLSLAVQHGGPLRRNGIVNPFWGHRDETRVLVGVGL